MSLTNKDLELITEIIAQSRPGGGITEDIIDAQIKVIEKQSSINTQILNEIQKVGENIKEQTDNSTSILNKLSNGISSDVKEIHDEWVGDNPKSMLEAVYQDVSSKDGYLPKINTRIKETKLHMKVLWSTIGVLALAIIGSVIYNWITTPGAGG